MALLHASTATLEGTAYFEFLPGPYREACWNDASVFLDEEAFGFVEPIFARHLPDYDHYAFIEISRPRWDPILADLASTETLLSASPSRSQLAAGLGFYFSDSERKFFEGLPRTAADVRAMIRDLTSWLRRQLNEHDTISLLGL